MSAVCDIYSYQQLHCFIKLSLDIYCMVLFRIHVISVHIDSVSKRLLIRSKFAHKIAVICQPARASDGIVAYFHTNMCFGKVFVTLLTLPWLNNAVASLYSNNSLLVLYNIPPQRLQRMLEQMGRQTDISNCKPTENGICIMTDQVCSILNACLLSLIKPNINRLIAQF